MRMHNVVCYSVCSPKNLNSSFHVIQLRLVSTNKDHIDGVPKSPQLRDLLRHEGAIPWSLRARIHIGNTKDVHVSFASSSVTALSNQQHFQRHQETSRLRSINPIVF